MSLASLSRLIGRRHAIATIVLGGLVLAAPAAQASPKIGAAAPDFTAIDSDGKTHRLSDLRGKTVVLEWTNDGCPYVRKHYGSGNMQKLQADATSKGVVWLSIVSSAPGTPMMKFTPAAPSKVNRLSMSSWSASAWLV